jgi:hypothetical protein
MFDWLTNFINNLTWQKTLFGLGVFIVSFAGNLAMVTFLLVRMPADYFHPAYDRSFMPGRRGAMRWVGVIGKNLLGLLLVALGLALSLPGVPGQGLLTILLGVVLLDIPGLNAVEHRLVRRPAVVNAINKLRARFDKPPLVLD